MRNPVFGLIVFLGSSKKKCPCCRQGMLPLSGVLYSANSRPENQGEWKFSYCPACGFTLTEFSSPWRRLVKRCDSCGCHGFNDEVHTIRHATSSSYGKIELSLACKHCGGKVTDYCYVPILGSKKKQFRTQASDLGLNFLHFSRRDKRSLQMPAV